MTVLVVLLVLCTAVAVADLLWLMHRAHHVHQRQVAQVVELTTLTATAAESLSQLDFIAAQFKTDSGSSLRDVIDRLDEAAKVSHRAAEQVKVQVDIARELAAQDRERLDRLASLVGYLDEQVAAGAATGLRIERSAEHVAEDLAARYQRADDTSGLPGEASDAAAQSAPPSEEQA